MFPWVLKDFGSSVLDLTDAGAYRDLSKPIGALNPDRLRFYQERMKELPDGEHRFLYGTHYSTPAYVLYYLVRQQPGLVLKLHSGRFDAPDRMFFSVKSTWESVLKNNADVKELIPEFYDVGGRGAFLSNSASLPLGSRQDGTPVSDVDLPRWAKSPMDFVTKMREALESDIVSEMLPSWIDLVFG